MTWQDTRLTELLGIRTPIIQAPMAGASTPAMAIAAAGAGALGSLGCAMMSPDKVRVDASQALKRSNGAINLNFFCHEKPHVDPGINAAAVARLAPWYEHFGVSEITAPSENNVPFDAAMCDVLLELRPRVASFHFGLPASEEVARLKDAKIIILSSATSAAEARWLEDHGADAIIAQGAEAGGHNGWFLGPEGDVAGLFSLLPRVVDATSLPVIAAGGIADGRGIAAAFAFGASGVQVGTAFLASPESAVPEVHKEAVVRATGDDTMASRAFSGRSARTITNAYAKEMASVDDWPDFPLMNAATGPLRAASAAADLPDAVSLWSGQGVGLARAETTRATIDRLVAETDAILG
ncbi:MAG: nitronate monooxygenase family protein [Pseudomonadota bacterium]